MNKRGPSYMDPDDVVTLSMGMEDLKLEIIELRETIRRLTMEMTR